MTRAELENRLRVVAMRLAGRQLARAAFSGVAGSAIVLGLAVVFLDLLPRLLFSATAGTVAMTLAAVIGFLIGVGIEMRRYKSPGLHEAALALEARLPHDTGALGAALRVVESNPFYRPLLARAAEELKQAEGRPAPVLISTRRLVLVPLLALVSGVAFAAVVSAERPVGDVAIGDAPAVGNRNAWSDVDVGGSRSQADRDAYRKALGMKETANQLSRSAATLRDSKASDQQRSNALSDARKALQDEGGANAGVVADELPDEVPADANEREKVADKLDAAANALKGAAAKVDAGKTGGTEDSGKVGEFNVDAKREDLVPMPAFTQSSGAGTSAIAAQTPARRAMAERAVNALNQLQEK